MAWECTEQRLTCVQAAKRFVAETFENREVNEASFRGGWVGKRGAWTFRLAGGRQIYRIEWDGSKWRCTADIMV